MNTTVFRFLVNIWPPLFFAGIKATYVSKDYREFHVALKLRWYNRNYVGVQYGGSLYSMTDPWYMLMLMNNLGKNYFVWDKCAEIEYVAPGRSHVYARFNVTEEELNEIRENTASGKKYLPQFTVDILDSDNTVVARVKRTLYIKQKPRARAAND